MTCRDTNGRGVTEPYFRHCLAHIFDFFLPIWGAAARERIGLEPRGFFCRIRRRTASSASMGSWSPGRGPRPHNCPNSAKISEKIWSNIKIDGGTPGRNIRTAIARWVGPVNCLSNNVTTVKIGPDLRSGLTPPFWSRNSRSSGGTPLPPPILCS